MSFLSQVLSFSCCFKKRSESADGPDERSRLIPPVTEQPTPQRLANPVDQDRMKERLGVIVRSKEGKMVNVNAPLPFNLHNKALQGRLEPSSSRSARGPSPQPSVDTAQSSGSASGPGDEDEPRRPVLNVRLVRAARGTGAARLGRRGRSRGRGGRTVSAEGDGGASADSRPASPEGEHDHDLDVHEQEAQSASSGDASRDADEGFKIQSVGSISRSWGD